MTKLKEHKNISKKCLLVIHSKRVQILPNAELSVPCKPGTPRTCFRLRQKIRYASTRCHVPPRYRNMPPYLGGGGLRRCHVSKAPDPSPPPRRAPALPCAQELRTLLAIREGSGAATRPSAPDPTLLIRKDSALTCILRLWTTPASVVDSGAGTCPMGLREPWAVEIKDGLAATAYGETRVFPRHAYTLPMRLQDVWADSVIMTCKPCGQALEHRTTVHRC
jgi:hypothetical protein